MTTQQPTGPNRLWHYTGRLTTHLGEILRTQHLRLDEIDPLAVRLGFRPGVWFSLNEQWEAIASKFPYYEGRPDDRGISIAARIGIDASTPALTWEGWYRQAAGRAKFRREREAVKYAFRQLTVSALKAGANLDDWRVLPEVVHAADWKAVEVYIGGKWVTYDKADDAHEILSSVTLPDGRQLKVSMRKARPGELADGGGYSTIAIAKIFPAPALAA